MRARPPSVRSTGSTASAAIDEAGGWREVWQDLTSTRLRHDRTDETFRAPRVLLGIGVVANFLILGYVIYDDPGSLLYCAALLGVGVVLFIAERVLGLPREPRP